MPSGLFFIYFNGKIILEERTKEQAIYLFERVKI